jgi:hypothetical protein
MSIILPNKEKTMKNTIIKWLPVSTAATTISLVSISWARQNFRI